MTQSQIANRKSKILYVNFHSKGRQIHEFFIGDRWHRITGPDDSTKPQLERILNRHLLSPKSALPEGIQITSR